ncbi:hypothetical protein EV182_001499 [Spiromyces aspiralis]|uniref:Uncharacterized protein n=1 Tax=Spiromyces aspiralis TaxID=68401 RepID=A0ACC1HFD7_9FUNG|nr:hypothetical protein EV182_001499 [Spiromyces aspiralis]
MERRHSHGETSWNHSQNNHNNRAPQQYPRPTYLDTSIDRQLAAATERRRSANANPAISSRYHLDTNVSAASTTSADRSEYPPPPSYDATVAQTRSKQSSVLGGPPSTGHYYDPNSWISTGEWQNLPENTRENIQTNETMNDLIYDRPLTATTQVSSAVPNLGWHSRALECPWCHANIQTEVRRKIRFKSGGSAVAVGLVFWPLFWVPLVIPQLKRHKHYCPSCHRCIGVGHHRND